MRLEFCIHLSEKFRNAAKGILERGMRTTLLTDNFVETPSECAKAFVGMRGYLFEPDGEFSANEGFFSYLDSLGIRK